MTLVASRLAGPKRTLVCGDPVVGLDEPPVIDDGAVVIEADRIVDVGPRREMIERHGPIDDVIGGADSIVVPGFVNAHSHTGTALGPGLFDQIFERAQLHIGPGHGPTSADMIRLRVLPTLLEAVRGGQTSMLDFNYGRWGMDSFAWDLVLAAYHEVGMRGTLGVVFRDQNRFAHEPDEQFLARFRVDMADEMRATKLGYAWPVDEVTATFVRLTDAWHGRDGLTHVGVAPDWTPACSDNLYRHCRDLANDHATVMSSHVLETRAEMIWNLRTHGVVATRRLADLGVLGPDVSFAHFVWATDEDVRILADSGVVAVTNPGSNLRLASGIARIRSIMEAGGRIALGTDGISFSDREDYLAELRLAGYLARTPDHFLQGRLDSLALLRAAGDNGARALGWPGELGRLAAGYLADVVVLDRNRMLHPDGRYDSTSVLDVLIDRGDHTDVTDVIINGNAVLRDREFTTVDEAAIRAASSAATASPSVADEQARRGHELGREAARELERIYEPWYRIPVTPASVYNSKAPPVL